MMKHAVASYTVKVCCNKYNCVCYWASIIGRNNYYLLLFSFVWIVTGYHSFMCLLHLLVYVLQEIEKDKRAAHQMGSLVEPRLQVSVTPDIYREPRKDVHRNMKVSQYTYRYIWRIWTLYNFLHLKCLFKSWSQNWLHFILH